jgi:hypothetical protein
VKRIPVGLTDEQHARLKREAARSHRSVGALIRHAVDEAYPDDAEVRRRLHARAAEAIGRYSSGKTDISERHDVYLAELDAW